ncbi:MAG: alpha/beta hydrolase [Pseudomonadota bacterium]
MDGTTPLAAIDVPARPPSRAVAIDDGTLNVYEWAAPETVPTLIFCHATGLNALTYRHMLGRLKGEARILALDARGHGRSTATADPKTLVDWYTYRDDLLRALDALGVDKAVLAGHSMGAVVSLLVAAHAPDRVTGLVLADPPLFAQAICYINDLRKRSGFGSYIPPIAKRAAVRRPDWRSRAEVFAAFRGYAVFSGWPDEVLADYIADGFEAPNGRVTGGEETDGGDVTLACRPEWEAATFTASLSDHWPAIKAVACPVSVLYAERQSTVAQPVRSRLARVTTTMDFETIKGSSHFLPMEFPDAVLAAIRRHLAAGIPPAISPSTG